MKRSSKVLSLFLIAVLLPSILPLAAASADAGLVGRLVVDPAVESESLSVVLIAPERGPVAESLAEPGGRYRIDRVPAGEYLLVLRDAEGRYAPVFDEPLLLSPGTVERRDIRVQPSVGDALAVQADDAGEAVDIDEEIKNYSRLRIWWVGLSGGKKTLTVLGVVAGAGLTYALLTDDAEVSPMVPASTK